MRYNLLVKKYEKNIRLHRDNAKEPNEVDKIDEFKPKHTEIPVEQKIKINLLYQVYLSKVKI